jgi:subtilisin family serine protease
VSGGRRWVRAAAPGENIVSALPGGRYGVWSGTSMAAPVAAGIAALVKAKNPSLAPTAIVDQVEDSGFEWDCFHAARGIQIKASRVDALCALGGAVCAPPPNPCQP